MRHTSCLLLLVCALSACWSKPKTVYIDYSTTTESSSSDGSVEGALIRSFDIPFREEYGVKLVPVQINGLKLDMIFDTGCSTTLISMAEANYLYSKGLLSRDDIIGTVRSQVADGRITKNMVVNLKEVILGDQLVFHDVEASVSENMQAPLLLGNEVLNRIASYTIDNAQQVIHVSPL